MPIIETVIQIDPLTKITVGATPDSVWLTAEGPDDSTMIELFPEQAKRLGEALIAAASQPKGEAAA